MDAVGGQLTVFFDGQFWVGVFVRVSDGRLSACKVTFGTEPKDAEVWTFVLDHYYELVFSPAVGACVRQNATNPKRRQRDAKRQLQSTGIGTKAQQALQKQREESAIQRRQDTKEERDAAKQRRFALKQQKRKAKHKGR